MTHAIRLATQALLAVIVLSVWVGMADAKVVVSESVTTYAIKGKTGIDLGKQMVVHGPKHIHMHRAVAATATKFQFLDPVLKVENGRCVVKDVTVKRAAVF